MAPLGPTAFAPLPLPAAFEFEWTPILSCNFLCLFSNSTPSFLHGLNQLGVATEGEIGCRFEGKATGRLPELALPGREYTHKSGYSRPPSSPAQFPLAACFRQALRSRSWNSGREACASSAPAFACAAFQSVQFFSEFYRFSQRG